MCPNLQTSVVIVFHNEGLSVLQRTIHSVMNRSPEAILQEVLLVDDFSSLDNLKDELEIYIKRFRGKVKPDPWVTIKKGPEM